MKIKAGDDAARTTAFAIRLAATGERCPAVCPVRKCRRDRSCTGPMLRWDAAADRHVLAGAGDAPEEIAPLCSFAADDLTRWKIGHFMEHFLKKLAGKPWLPLPEQTRAIAARRWRGFPASPPDPHHGH